MQTLSPILIDLPVPIYTPRLMLRQPLPGDGKAQYEALAESAADLRPWLSFLRSLTPISPEESEIGCRKAYAAFILREDLRFHIYDRQNGMFLGSTGLHRFDFKRGVFEIGYWVRSSQVGKGYITETTNALTRYCFGALGAKRVHLYCNADNQRSRAVPERLGFECEARLKNFDRYADDAISSRDEIVYARFSLEGLPDLDVSWGE